jgi:gas vesicle protein
MEKKEQKEQVGNALKGIAVLACGVAIGATAGVLLAPAKGSTIRRRIGRNIQHVSDNVQDKIENKIEDLKDSLSK